MLHETIYNASRWRHVANVSTKILSQDHTSGLPACLVLFLYCSMTYDGINTTGFASPATIYLEAVIDLAEILDLRRPSRYPVRVIGGALPARGIAEKDILVVDCAKDRAPDRVCVAMAAGEVFLAVLKRSGATWFLVRSLGDEVEVTGDVEVWGIVTSIVREAV